MREAIRWLCQLLLQIEGKTAVNDNNFPGSSRTQLPLLPGG